MAFSDVIARLAVSLSLDTAAFTTGSRKAQAEAKGLQGRLAGVGKGVATIAGGLAAFSVGSTIADFVSQAFDMASALSEDAEKLGLTVEGLQELRFAANQSGIDNEKLSAALQKLNRSMGDLQMGKKAAVDAFAAIGLSAADLKGMDPQAALSLIADALNRLPDAQQRVAVGAQLMGRSFSELLPMLNGGSKALDDWRKQAIAAGEISTQDAKNMDEAADAWDKFKTAVTVATANIVAGLIPAAKAIGNFLDNTRAFFAGVHDKIVGFAKDILDWMGRVAKAAGALTQFGPGGGKMHAAFTQFAEEGGLQLAAFATQAESVSVRVQKTFKDMADATLGALDRLSGAIKGGGFLNILSAVVGLGLQLGSIGAFGKTVAGRINGTLPGGTTAPRVPSSTGGALSWVSAAGAAPAINLTVAPSPLFTVTMDNRIGAAAPGIASMGGQVGVQRLTYRQSRTI